MLRQWQRGAAQHEQQRGARPYFCHRTYRRQGVATRRPRPQPRPRYRRNLELRSESTIAEQRLRKIFSPRRALWGGLD